MTRGHFITGIQGDFYDKNLFAYCDNNPVIRKDSNGKVWFVAVAIGAGIGLVGQYASDVIDNISSGKKGLDVLKVSSSGRDYLASAIGGGIAAIPGLNLTGTAAVGALGNVVSDSIKGNIRNGKDLILSATWGAGANSIGYMASKEVATLKVKQINNMPRARQKNYINRNLYGGSQAYVNINYHNYMSKTTAGKIVDMENNLRVFSAGIYSTITSTVTGLFRR